jgi:hypothetical protein
MVHELNAFGAADCKRRRYGVYASKASLMRLWDEARRQIGIDFGAGEAL